MREKKHVAIFWTTTVCEKIKKQDKVEGHIGVYCTHTYVHRVWLRLFVFKYLYLGQVSLMVRVFDAQCEGSGFKPHCLQSTYRYM